MRASWLLVGLALGCGQCLAAEPEARALLRAALEHWRGETSYLEHSMTIQRPGWRRSVAMRGWTAGGEQSLMRVTAPARDAGSATLLKGGSMWSYSPKINRVIKIPSAMMGQSWMGSDFSNRDINRSTDILDKYRHRIVDSYRRDGFAVHVVEAIPHEHAAVVWGRELLHIRSDHVLLRQEFWDQDGVLAKRLETLEVRELGGRAVAALMRMGRVAAPGEWTEIRVDAIRFDAPLPAGIFTLSNLRNPRQ